jgi:hypothetical protein|tara:strand:- start:289 stop:678 length:390 start_codon:yes stop_codon:yes gene_type:complete
VIEYVEMSLILRPWQTATLTASFWLIKAGSALAQVYSGGGVKAGVSAASGTGVSDVSLKSLIGNIVDQALLFVSLLAVTVIIIAGFYLILGMGSDSSRETAKKIIIYVSVGLLVIILSKLFVNLIKSLV